MDATRQTRKQAWRQINCGKQLYSLIASTIQSSTSLILGTYRGRKNISTTPLFALQEVCKTLLSNSVVPVLLGGSKELGPTHNLAAFQKIVKNLEASVDHISPTIDLDKHAFLNKICLHEPKLLVQHQCPRLSEPLRPRKSRKHVAKAVFQPNTTWGSSIQHGRHRTRI